jgi:succinylarginine dihydrolase
MTTREFNFDGLVGPTHNYAGLSPGNLASTRSVGRRSHPRRAALQGLEKMAMLHAMGIRQAVLPPQPRPELAWLRQHGLHGSDAQVIERAARMDTGLLAAAYSASSMWAANAATVVPSTDSGDGRLHLVPANLTSQRHRSIEAVYTANVLRAVFPSESHFAHHAPVAAPGDEGAANHIRLCREHGEPGLELFVFGEPSGAAADSAPDRLANRPLKHPARQTEAASRAVARRAGLGPDRAIFLQQNPDAIDAGVFHNDVIATGDRALLLLHEDAFFDQARAVAGIREAFARRCGSELRVEEISRRALPISRAVESYLFNCQIVLRPDGRTAWIGPLECRDDPATLALLSELSDASGPFDELHFVDLSESMWNGGGPACLRLRIVLNDDEQAASHEGVHFDADLHSRLISVIEQHYREQLDPEDLADPLLIDESRSALDALTRALGIGSVFDLQHA